MHRLALALPLAALVVGCSPTPSTSPTRSAPVVPTATGTLLPAPSPTSAPATFADGEHRVGDDIQPGTYRAIASDLGGDGFCYWERVSGFGGTEAETIANAAGVGPRVVTIAPRDAGFISDDCGTWTSDLARLPGPIGDGVWIVGTDILPGRYTSDGGSSCVWQRISGFGGTSEESLEVGLSGAVEILPADAGFSSSHCGTWVAQAG